MNGDCNFTFRQVAFNARDSKNLVPRMLIPSQKPSVVEFGQCPEPFGQSDLGVGQSVAVAHAFIVAESSASDSFWVSLLLSRYRRRRMNFIDDQSDGL